MTDSINTSDPYDDAGPFVMPDTPAGRAFLASHPDAYLDPRRRIVATVPAADAPRPFLARIAPLAALVGLGLFVVLAVVLMRDDAAHGGAYGWGVLVLVVAALGLWRGLRRRWGR